MIIRCLLAYVNTSKNTFLALTLINLFLRFSSFEGSWANLCFFYIRISRIHWCYRMIVTVRFRLLRLRHLRVLSRCVVPPNDPRKLSGRESDADSYLFRTWWFYRGSTVPKIDVNFIKWNAKNSRIVEQFWLCLGSHSKEDIHKKGQIFVALKNLKE